MKTNNHRTPIPSQTWQLLNVSRWRPAPLHVSVPPVVLSVQQSEVVAAVGLERLHEVERTGTAAEPLTATGQHGLLVHQHVLLAEHHPADHGRHRSGSVGQGTPRGTASRRRLRRRPAESGRAARRRLNQGQGRASSGTAQPPFTNPASTGHM